MALKDTWVDLEDAIPGMEDSGDDVAAEPINDIAHAVIDLEDYNDEGITTAKINESAVTTDKINNEAVTTPKIYQGAVTETRIANGAVTTSKITDSAVTTDKINNGAVNIEKLAPYVQTYISETREAVDEIEELLDDGITAANIADGAVTTPKIVNSAVTTEKINGSAITTAKIAANAVTTYNINNNAIITDKILNGAVTTSKIAAEAVTPSKIANNAVITDKILNSAITTGKIAAKAVTTDKIADNAITETQLDDYAVTSNKLSSELAADIASREVAANKGQPNGYAPLDANGKLSDSYLYGTTVKQYGVRWNGTSLTVCERLGDAVGLVANAHLGSYDPTIQNDFDAIYPWSDMKTCNIDADGNIIAYAGDPKFNRNGVSVITTSSTVTVYKLNAKPLTVTSVTLNGVALTADTDYTYDASTGNLTLAELPTSEVADNMTVKHSVYDVMVEIPKFYYKRVKTGVVEEFWICGVQLPGYELHPLFYNDGVEVSKVFHSAYNASSYTDSEDNKVKLRSISGEQPSVRTSRANFRTYARNKGTIWGIEDISCVNALQLLYLVEYATTNSQSALGSGVNGLSYTANHRALEETTDSNTITIASTYKNVYKLGQRIEIGTSQGSNNKTSTPRTITAIETDEDAGQTTITFDGDPISVAFGDRMWNVAPLNGSCDSLNGKSGWVAGANNYADHYADVNYRGVEGFHGKLFRFIDGVNVNNKVVHYSNSMADYADGVYSGKYRAIGYTNAASNGYISSFGYDEIAPWVMFPTETSGSSSTYIPDYYYQTSGERVLLLGGNSYNGAYGGVFYFYCFIGFSDSLLTYGAHLLVKKP